MANIIPETIRQAQQFVMGSHGDKLSDLEADTRTVSDKDRMTTDYGVLQANTDESLRVMSGDKTGPMLMEDAFGREKVKLYLLRTIYICKWHVITLAHTVNGYLDHAL